MSKHTFPSMYSICWSHPSPGNLCHPKQITSGPSVLGKFILAIFGMSLGADSVPSFFFTLTLLEVNKVVFFSNFFQVLMVLSLLLCYEA